MEFFRKFIRLGSRTLPKAESRNDKNYHLQCFVGIIPCWLGTYEVNRMIANAKASYFLSRTHPPTLLHLLPATQPPSLLHLIYVTCHKNQVVIKSRFLSSNISMSQKNRSHVTPHLVSDLTTKVCAASPPTSTPSPCKIGE